MEQTAIVYNPVIEQFEVELPEEVSRSLGFDFEVIGHRERDQVAQVQQMILERYQMYQLLTRTNKRKKRLQQLAVVSLAAGSIACTLWYNHTFRAAAATHIILTSITTAICLGVFLYFLQDYLTGGAPDNFYEDFKTTALVKYVEDNFTLSRPIAVHG